MKKLNKKGFTIVELVIVIAVIAILAAVLIPTFAKVIENANKSAALQEARNMYTEYLADFGKDIGSAKTNAVIHSGNYYFAVVGGQMNATAFSAVSGDNIKTLFSTPASVTVSDTGEAKNASIFGVTIN